MNFIKTEIKPSNLGSRATSLIKKVANEKVNKLESKPFANLAGLQDIYENSDMSKLRQKLGKILSYDGKAAMFALPFRDTYILDVMEVSDYDVIGKYELVIKGSTGAVYTHTDGSDYDVWTELYYIDSTPYIKSYINIEERLGEVIELDIREATPLPTTTLPVELFWNNESGESDIEYAGVEKQLLDLNALDATTLPEWYRTRTQISVNSNFSDETKEEVERQIDNGQGMPEQNSFNEKLGNGVTMLPVSAGTQVLAQDILFIEDDIYKKIGMSTDTINSGSNNTVLEVVKSNQFGLELILRQRDIRQKHYNQFFGKIAELLNVTAPTVTLELTDVDQATLDLLDGMVLEAQTKAQNISSQANQGQDDQEGDE